MVAPSSDVTYDLSVIVVSYNTRHLLDEMMSCLEVASKGLTVQVIIVDNASVDGSANHIRRSFPNVELIANENNVGFGRANNQALPKLRGRFVLLLNTDAFMAPSALQVALACMERHPSCGIVGLRILGQDGTLQPSCRYFPNPWNLFVERTGLNRIGLRVKLVDNMSWAHDSERICDWVPGCFYLIRREVIENIGLFDPRFFLYYEEVDHCWRTNAAGWSVVFCPESYITHLGGESAKTVSEVTTTGRQIHSLQIESEQLFFRKHYGIAGLIISIVLNILSEIYDALRGLIRTRKIDNSRISFLNSILIFRKFFETRFGSHPTR